MFIGNIFIHNLFMNGIYEVHFLIIKSFVEFLREMSQLCMETEIINVPFHKLDEFRYLEHIYFVVVIFQI